MQLNDKVQHVYLVGAKSLGAYAKQKYNPDYIVISNNDVVFFQKDFERKIMQIYKETHFDILGPDIYVPRHGDHQSPMFKKPISISQLENEIKEYPPCSLFVLIGVM